MQGPQMIIYFYYQFFFICIYSANISMSITGILSKWFDQKLCIAIKMVNHKQKESKNNTEPTTLFTHSWAINRIFGCIQLQIDSAQLDII